MSPLTQAWRPGRFPDYVSDFGRNRFWVRPKEPPTVPGPQWKAELSAHAAGILGDNGVARFREFWSYRDGWDFGSGKTLSPISVFRMECFLEHYCRFGRRPSLFLTEQGNLMLAWEDPADCRIELEFAQDGYSLFLESTDEERHFAANDMTSLVEALSQVNANGAS